jgi:hypothetical protein
MARFMVSTVACRMVLMFELAGMRSARGASDISVSGTEYIGLSG